MTVDPLRKLNIRHEADLTFVRTHVIRVFVDGIEQRFVYAYDVSKRWVKRAKLTAKGCLQTNAGEDRILTEYVSGTVTVDVQSR